MRINFPLLLLPGILGWACSSDIGSGTPPLDVGQPDPGATSTGGVPTSSVSPIPGQPTGSAAPNAPSTADNPTVGSTAATDSSGNPIVGTTGGTNVDPATVSPGTTPSVSADPTAPAPNADGLIPAATDFVGAPIYTRFMRLTNSQWARAVKDLLKLADLPNTSTFEREIYGATDFVNNEAQLSVTNTQWEQYQLAAEAIVQQVTSANGGLSGVYSGTDAQGFIRQFGRRAFRRPLTDAEVATYQTQFDTGAALSGTQSEFTKGAGLVVEAMLQSPYFLYRTELGAVGEALNGYEVASKLSFWLLGTTPSDALLDQAAAGALDTPSGVSAQAASMLATPEAVDVMRQFHSELLQYRRFADISKSDPQFDPAMNPELEQISAAFFDRIFSENLGVADMLTSTQGYVGPKTAALYGVTAPASGIALQDFGPSRAGYFAQVPYLMLWGTSGGQADSIHRGSHFHIDVLCGELGLPSSVVKLNDPIPDQTNRERVDASTGLNTCGASCHGHYINPLGFAFENFDGLGRERTTDNGKPVDTSGAYPLPGETVTFQNSSELMTAIANNDMVHTCYAKHIAEYALQRDIVADDLPVLQEMAAISKAKGSVKDLILDLVKNPAFRVRAGGAL